MPVQQVRLSFAYTETFEALFDGTCPNPRLTLMGNPAAYEAAFAKVTQELRDLQAEYEKQAEPLREQFAAEPEALRVHLAQLTGTLRRRQNVPGRLTTSWLGLGEKYLDSFWQYYLENRSPLQFPLAKAWHFVVPLRYVLPVRIENPFGENGPRCRVLVDGLVYPHGLAAVITLQIWFGRKENDSPNAERGLALDGMMRRALEARSGLLYSVSLPDGARKQMKLDALGAEVLDQLRKVALGENVPQGARPTTSISVASIINATGWQGGTRIDEEPTLHRALEGLCTWKENWASVNMLRTLEEANLLLDNPSDGDAVYHSATGRAVWMPAYFQPGGKPHTLSCYHRNLTWVTLQTEMLAQLASMAAIYLERGEAIPSPLEDLAKSAVTRLGLLYASKKSRKTITYNSASPRLYLEDNGYVEDVNRIRKYFKWDDLKWEQRAE